MPSTRITSLIYLPLLLTIASGAEPLREIAAWQRSPESCERRALLQHLRHEDVRVRSAALDLLEFITGRDFGLDPWLAPAEVPEEVQRALEEWSAVEESAGDAATAPEPEQLAATVALLRTADPDTQRRLCLRYAPWRPALAAALQKELAQHTELPEKERDNLRCSLFRLQLQNALPADVGHVATLLTSHARNDILEGLEALRKVGKDALPILMSYADAADGLVREVAVDVLLQTGGAQAYKILMPRLIAETDRNILQIAARRAPDCPPLVPIITFLNKCALAEDEDVAVAALEALADMETDADDGEDRKTSQLSGAAQALAVGDFVRLLQSPNWRVRAATLRAMQSKGSFLPSINDKDLQAALIQALRNDTDETVRSQAMQVLHKRKLVSRYMEELTEYSVRTPSATPYLVYLYCEQKTSLTPALQDAVSRFSPEQVDMLVHYDDEYETVFDADGVRRKSVGAVLDSLLANPDPRVKRRVMVAWGARLFGAKREYAEAFMAWLADPSAPAVDKATALQRLAFDRISSHEREEECVNILCDWLQKELREPSMQDAALQSVIYASLLNLRPPLAEGLLDARVEKLQPELLNELLRSHPEYLLKLRREFAENYLQKHADSYTVNRIVEATESKSAPGLGELLASMPLSDENWEALIHQELSSLQDNEEAACPALRKALSAEAPAARRAEAAFLLCSYVPNHPEVKPVLESAGEPTRSALQCLVEAPQKEEAMLPWAQKYHKHACPEVRRAVAACLLPFRAWRFYLPRSGENALPLEAAPLVARRFPDVKRVSCPLQLIRLVQAMQQDEDPHVALLACGSMLYRTGDCSRSRLTELLAYLRALRKEGLADDDNDYIYDRYRSVCRPLEEVWRRWTDYRSSVEEFYKLKGSPKKLRPGLDKLLADFAEAIDDYPWSVIEEVKDQLPSRSSASRKDTAAQPHEFDFPAPPAAAEPEPQPDPPAESAAVDDEPDAPEPPPAPPVAQDAPVRVEFFHKEGCEVCKRVQQRLERLKAGYPGLEIVDYDVESETGRERNTVLCSRFGVAPKDRRKAPALFAEAGVLLGDDAASERLDSLVRESHAAGQKAQRLAASPPEGQPADSPTPPPAGSEPQDLPQEAQPALLAESTATETAAATGEHLWDLLRSYGMLAVGALVALLGALVLLFGRSKDKENAK